MSISMYSIALGAVALAALPAPGPTGSGGAGGGASGIPFTSAIVEQCVTAPTQADRSVTFTGQMETVAGTHRMAMEIVVQEHLPSDAGFHVLLAAGPAAWQRSEVGVKIYKYVRQVTDLPAPAGFRAVVMYRWLNEKGRVLRSDERRTPICRQSAEHPKPEAGTTTGTTPSTGTTPTAGTTPTTGTTSSTGTTSAAGRMSMIGTLSAVATRWS
jgi:hypothetical protein